jgi:hypothetical protein
MGGSDGYAAQVSRLDLARTRVETLDPVAHGAALLADGATGATAADLARITTHGDASLVGTDLARRAAGVAKAALARFTTVRTAAGPVGGAPSGIAAPHGAGGARRSAGPRPGQRLTGR